MLTAAEKMEHDQYTIATINHQRAIKDQSSWPFLDFSSSVRQSLKKLAVVERFFVAVGYAL